MLKPFYREASVPDVILVAEQDEEYQASTRFYSVSWMPSDMGWPFKDGKPMNFVMQLHTSDMQPDFQELIGKEGLLLFFVDGYDLSTNILRLVDPKAQGSIRATPDGAKFGPALPPDTVKSFREAPSLTELDEGDDEGYKQLRKLNDFASDYYFSSTIDMVRDADGNEISAYAALTNGIETRGELLGYTKIGGWPEWAQGVETPSDDQGNAMVYVAQPPWTQKFQYVWACD